MKKVMAGIGTALLAIGLTFTAVSPAQAVYGNGVANTGSKTICFDAENGGRYCTSGGQKAYSVRYLVLPKGQCVYTSWALTQCAGSYGRLITVPGGLFNYASMH